MTSRPDNNRSADNQPANEPPANGQPPANEGPDPTANEAAHPLGTTIPGMMPIIDVRAKSVEGDAAAKNNSTNSRPKTDRGQDMFPDVAEVPAEYSGLFQDYDNTSGLGVEPLWLEGTENTANSRFKVPTLMLGGVVLTALASGMGLAQIHNLRQASVKADPKSPKSTATQRPGDRNTAASNPEPKPPA
jgi:hypothetical protein